jgi:DNA polymerase-3 subunit gamma/tau
VAEEKYKVLARKYRPSSLPELIGQEVLVRTLTNAIAQNRLHHAYIFTGIRGVGKTSTARILAKSLNCSAQDGPSVEPCGKCENCQAIKEDRHMDVIEMDAASHTSVDDIREIIDGAQYKPTMARYKVYIIDEVHMLSKSAFNAILKTLEEPPPYVKFIFATTEIRKVPPTVLSRCQRFDLAAVEPETLSAHFKKIASLEGISIDDDALSIVAKVADGSVRDGLSFLDQIIANSIEDDKAITAADVAKILGLSARGATLDLFDAIAAADTKGALVILENAQKAGADPVMLLGDLLEVVHFLTRTKVQPDSLSSLPMTGAEQERLREMAAKLSIATLARTWQMLIKAFDEMAIAPSPAAALEMAVIRIAHIGTLPSPAEVIAKIESGASSAEEQKKKLALSQDDAAPTPLSLETSEALSALLKSKRSFLLSQDVEKYARFVGFDGGALRLNFAPSAPREIVSNLNAFFAENHMNIKVEKSDEPGAPTVAEAAETLFNTQVAEFASNPILKEILEIFPNSYVAKIETAV